MILEVADAAQEFTHRSKAVVIVGGREVRQHLTAVQAFPEERGSVRLVELIPRQFLRQEEAHARAAHDLGQGGRVAERIRQPEFFGSDAKFLLKEALTVQE